MAARDYDLISWYDRCSAVSMYFQNACKCFFPPLTNDALSLCPIPIFVHILVCFAFKLGTLLWFVTGRDTETSTPVFRRPKFARFVCYKI